MIEYLIKDYSIFNTLYRLFTRQIILQLLWKRLIPNIFWYLVIFNWLEVPEFSTHWYKVGTLDILFKIMLIFSTVHIGGLPLKQASSAWACILPWFRVLSRYISWSQTFGCLILIPTQAVLGCSSEMQWVLDVLWKFSALITSRRPPIY